MTLFQPDNLCRTSLELVPATGALAAKVGRVFPGRVLMAPETNGVTQCFVVERETEKLFVKASLLADGLARFRQEADRARRLAAAPVPRLASDVVEHEGVAFLAFAHIEGEHFTNQVGAAARAFAELTRVAAGVIEERASVEPIADVLADLARLVPKAGKLVAAHAAAIARAEANVQRHENALAADVRAVHVDFHPLNLLFAGSELRAVLDLEDLLVYPVAIASGFGAYKLIRRAAVAAGAPDPQHLPTWIAETRLGIAQPLLAAGARARLLTLLRLILKTYLDDNDDRFLFDLEKHARALVEIDVIFGPGD